MTDLNKKPELLIDYVECLYHHSQSKNEVRLVVTAMVKSDTTSGKSI